MNGKRVLFRVSSNELSFGTVESWKAIYGFPSPGAEQLVKGDFYDVLGSAITLHLALSAKSLSEQEPIVQECLDRFVGKLKLLGEKSEGKGLDLVHWLELVAFDISGGMAFGEGFGCERHSWIDLILSNLFEVAPVDNMRRVKVVAAIGRQLLPLLTSSVRNKHSMYSRAKMQKRLEASAPRQDFLAHLASKVLSDEVSQEEMTAHTSTLVLAGSETVAARNIPHVEDPCYDEKLINEIRTRYASYNHIDATSATRLPYLQAVINEPLRIFPPGPTGFPCVSSGCEIAGFWAKVYTSSWTVTHDPNTFKPERWLDPECRDIKHNSQPFLLGYRACIDRSQDAFRYDLELVSNELDWEVACWFYVMWWKSPLMVMFKERAQQ
ncbi:putative cytochrome P450 [Hypoxylon sp. FL1857]|nr:putative cytochrome P450 [Hypoxylon sp. FL1857]